MKKHKIAVIVGSLRKESFNLKTAKAITKLASHSMDFEFIEIGQLPFFNDNLKKYTTIIQLNVKSVISGA